MRKFGLLPRTFRKIFCKVSHDTCISRLIRKITLPDPFWLTGEMDFRYNRGIFFEEKRNEGAPSVLFCCAH